MAMLDKIGEKIENLNLGGKPKTPTTPSSNDQTFKVERTFDPSQYNIEDGETTYMVDPQSRKDSKLIELMTALLDWINNELSQYGIVVKDIEEDLFDGLVLGQLLVKLTGRQYDFQELTGSLVEQRQKMERIVEEFNYLLQLDQSNDWDAELIHEKDLVAILKFLVSISRQFKAPVRIPPDVTVRLVEVTKKEGKLVHNYVTLPITGSEIDGIFQEPDAFDELFEQGSKEKLQTAISILRAFVEKMIRDIDYEVKDEPLEVMMHDGVYFIFIIAIVENFFVPFNNIHLTPKSKEEKLQNMKIALQLMQDCQIAKPKIVPENIVEGDLKSILRFLYIIYAQSKRY
ncbi:alpha-parvin-like [Symsagittifera roscoffensis]|uniref:alpha-parvin-like n=1 Tax=Symsagittifera roscoffensis TaxID=84072 RepID=UPI00307C0149